MFRMTVSLLLVLGGLLLAITWMDHWGLLGWLHNRTWPDAVISRRPTELELHTKRLRLQIEQIDAELQQINCEIVGLRTRRQQLAARLSDELRDEPFPGDLVPEYLDEHHVVRALVRSIDQVDQEVRRVTENLNRINAQKELLEARVITSSNGVGVLELRDSPGDLIGEQRSGSESTLQRYTTILRQSRQSL